MIDEFVGKDCTVSQGWWTISGILSKLDNPFTGKIQYSVIVVGIDDIDMAAVFFHKDGIKNFIVVNDFPNITLK